MKAKRYLSLLLALVMALALAVPAFAAESNDEVFTFADPFTGVELYGADQNSKQIFKDTAVEGEHFIDPALVGTTNPDGIMPLDRYNEIPYVREIITTNQTVYVTPTKQPPLGYRGGSGATVFFFSAGGSSVKFTVTINSELVTFSTETGVANSSGSGYAAPVPDGTGNYRFEFIKYYVITSKIVDVYQYGQYKESFVTHNPEYSLGHRWVKV